MPDNVPPAGPASWFLFVGEPADLVDLPQDDGQAPDEPADLEDDDPGPVAG